MIARERMKSSQEGLVLGTCYCYESACSPEPDSTIEQDAFLLQAGVPCIWHLSKSGGPCICLSIDFSKGFTVFTFAA